jgi:SAM-dependent methyltransferase
MLSPAQIDIDYFALLRENVDCLLKHSGQLPEAVHARVLDIAPQTHKGARHFFPASAVVETLDIDPKSGATYIADICKTNDDIIPSETFDLVVCTEVLEHTLQPFAAVAEIFRFMRPGGLLIASTPYNFRIHGPLPDCWRFTEHGIRALLSSFEDVQIKALETPGRPLMPLHYTFTARRPE